MLCLLHLNRKAAKPWVKQRRRCPLSSAPGAPPRGPLISDGAPPFTLANTHSQGRCLDTCMPGSHLPLSTVNKCERSPETLKVHLLGPKILSSPHQLLPEDLVSEIRTQDSALAGVAQSTEPGTVNQRIMGSIPSQGICLGCRPGAQ